MWVKQCVVTGQTAAKASHLHELLGALAQPAGSSLLSLIRLGWHVSHLHTLYSISKQTALCVNRTYADSFAWRIEQEE